MAGGFQTQVAVQPAIGIAGDRASDNPIMTYPAGPGGLVAGAAGVTIGQFAWVTSPLDPDNAPSVVNSSGVGNVAGFVIGDLQGLNSTFLSYAGMTILEGLPVTLATGGDFIAINQGSAQAQRGMKAYANFSTGAVSFAAANSPTTASATASTISAGTTASFTGSISGNVLTATAVSNTIYPGAVITTGVGVAANTVIQSQITSTAAGGALGGAGTYYVSIGEQSVAAESMVATPYVLDTTGGTVTGTIGVGGVIQSASTGVTGTVVGMAVTAAYATGKWVVQPAGFGAAGTLTSATVTVSNNVETPWYALNSAAQNEPVKIGSVLASFSSTLS
jgi:hypothetical protein